VAAAAGFASLIVAQNLGTEGDTMEMMRAVLDSNFWLATHVVTITIGYAGTFLAGTIAIVWALRPMAIAITTRLVNLAVKARAKHSSFQFWRAGFTGYLFVLIPIMILSSESCVRQTHEWATNPNDRETSIALADMAYGIICFSLFFSFVGTVLGGIWADQSWGRFWGWDPKENGALLIVLWNAIILHARMAGYVRERGIMVMAIFGNIITACSWFGVNMLGVGLHSYGFMDQAFYALTAFIASQLVLMGICYAPTRFWVQKPHGKA